MKYFVLEADFNLAPVLLTYPDIERREFYSPIFLTDSNFALLDSFSFRFDSFSFFVLFLICSKTVRNCLVKKSSE